MSKESNKLNQKISSLENKNRRQGKLINNLHGQIDNLKEKNGNLLDKNNALEESFEHHGSKKTYRDKYYKLLYHVERNLGKLKQLEK